jgi:hypothetical protein
MTHQTTDQTTPQHAERTRRVKERKEFDKGAKIEKSFVEIIQGKVLFKEKTKAGRCYSKYVGTIAKGGQGIKDYLRKSLKDGLISKESLKASGVNL